MKKNGKLTKEGLKKYYNIYSITQDEQNIWHVWSYGYKNGIKYDEFGQPQKKQYVELNIVDSTSLCKHKENKIYKMVCVKCRGFNTYIPLSRVLYAYFIGDIPEGSQIDHIDNNPENNDLSNLQLLTVSENLIKRSEDDPTVWCNGFGPKNKNTPREQKGDN